MRTWRRVKLPSFSGRTAGWRRRQLALIFVLIFGVGGLSSEPLPAREVPFAAQQVISTLAESPVSVVSADVDGDGDLDVLSASSFDSTIAWYENVDGDGSFGVQQVISTLADFAQVVAAADLDGDGDVDVLSGSSSDNTIAWYENLGGGSFGSQQVISTRSLFPFFLLAADVDGDGDLDVLSASGVDDKVAWHENTDGAGAFASEQIISTFAAFPVAVFAADVDGDGDLDVLSASLVFGRVEWYENTDGLGTFGPQRFISFGVNGAYSVFAADLDGDGDVDVLSASRDDDKIAWYENTDGAGTFGSQQVLTTLAGGARSVFAADVDGDGDVDVLSASFDDDKIAWYENTDGAGTFGSQQVLTTLAGGARSVFAADVDGDGDVDVLSASRDDDKVAWYENETIHRSAVFPEQAVISSLAGGAFLVFAADVDGDGDLDVVSASSYDDEIAWYENTDGAGSFGSQQVISTLADSARSVYAADVDGDGDLDVLSASSNDDKIAWYENIDGAGTFGSQQVISTLADGAFSVFAADIDGDGDVDALSASTFDDEIAWYENIDGAGSFGPQQVIWILANGARSVFAADVDGDGDLDVLSASAFDDRVAWYENRDGAGDFGAQQPISTVADGASSVFAADLDADGDLDVVSASADGDTVAWHENANGEGGFVTGQIVSTSADGAFSVVAGDLDADGDLDILSASVADDKIAWYENTDGAGTFGSERVLSTLAEGAFSVFAADLDGDGDLDALSASVLDGEIAWYENRGGQFALVTVPLAQGVLANGQEKALFQIEMRHRGRAGDSPVELASLELLFEDGSGTPLSSAEANALIDKLELFLDDGSGGFEPGADTLVEQVGALSPVAGVQSLSISAGDPDAQMAFGSIRRYFVVVTMTGDADAQSPGSFEAIHLSEATSSGRDGSAASVPLTLEHAPNTRTGTIDTVLSSASCRSPHDLDLEGFTVSDTVVCEAGSALTAGNGLAVVSPGDLTLRAGKRVVLGVDFSVGSGGRLKIEVDPALVP